MKREGQQGELLRLLPLVGLRKWCPARNGLSHGRSIRMPASDLIAVRCLVAQSGPLGERVFRITQASGEVYVGVAPQEYCYTRAGKLLPDDWPTRGKREEGLISARTIQDEGDDRLLVSGPDGAALVLLQ